ncbi:uncharacterized protein A4U43_C07F36120 [Asparagus officinalis]|uniref:Transmembrane 9 superfamily member n=1 Tax=Asparagus officinalis TaxID=4686 RepID=A0A5P1EL90_ASPOF|nr:uncharacterized protein A4U43_C07F36120 [Asparagus officinalis]
MENSAVAFVALLLCVGVGRVVSDASDHRYKTGDPVPFYANKVGPFHNPSETYRYFDLPFCAPEHVRDKSEALGEVLNGDRLVDAPYKLDFRVDLDSKSICRKELTKEDVAQFRSALQKDYYFQMYYDDLPIWGFIGKVDKEGKVDPSDYKYYLYRHIHFDVSYNNDRVIEINIHTDISAMLDVTEDRDVEVEFLYSVKWKETPTPFEKRMEKYSQSSSMPHHLEIHWFSIINSCVTVLLLTGFLATILMRVLKNDFVKSFLCGGSTGLFIYAYCLYYYYARSDMSGFMQTSFFFGYMACICYGFFLMLGMVGFRASLLFVRHIYRSIKCE